MKKKDRRAIRQLSRAVKVEKKKSETAKKRPRCGCLKSI